MVYHHGPVAIYDTAGLGVTQVHEGFVGERPMGLGRLGDALWGAAAAGLILALRRWRVIRRSPLRDLEGLEIGISLVAVVTLLGVILFALRLMPGRAFTAGSCAFLVVGLVAERKRTVRRLLARLLPRHPVDPLVPLGILAGVAGLAIGIHGTLT